MELLPRSSRFTVDPWGGNSGSAGWRFELMVSLAAVILQWRVCLWVYMHMVGCVCDWGCKQKQNLFTHNVSNCKLCITCARTLPFTLVQSGTLVSFFYLKIWKHCYISCVDFLFLCFWLSRYDKGFHTGILARFDRQELFQEHLKELRELYLRWAVIPASQKVVLVSVKWCFNRC